MSLLLHHNFNENDNSVVYDYSTNGKDATTINNLVIASGELGFAGRFNGTDADIIFGDVGGVGGTDKVSVFCKFNKDLDKVQYLAYKRDNYRLYLNISGNVVFGVYISGAWFEATSTEAVNSSEWVEALGVYDGTNIYIYIAGVQDGITAKSGNIDASANDYIIGSKNADYFDGDIEQVAVWNTAHSAVQALAHANNSIGIKCKTLKAHNLELGDLISADVYGTPVNMVVTYKDDSTTYRALPISGKINFGQTPVRRGNIYQTGRQWISEFIIDSGVPVLQIYDGIKNFSPTSPNFKVLKDGSIIIAGALTGGGAGHDQFSDFVANEHIDWTNATQNFLTTGDITSGAVTTSGKITVSFANPDVQAILLNAVTGTNAVGMKFSNGGGNSFLGLDNSIGTRFLVSGGTGGYQLVMSTESAIPLILGTNNVGRLKIDSDGNVEILKDLIFSGSGSGLVRGEISVVSNTNEVVIVTQNVYVQIRAFDRNGESNNTTPDHTNNHILIDIAGVYFITCSITLESIGGAGSTAEMEVQKNDGASRLGALHVDRTLSGGGAEAGAIPMSGHATLAVNDTVEVWIKNESNTQNYIVEDITLSVTLVGGV